MLEFLTLKPEAFGLSITDRSLEIIKLKKKGEILSLASYGEAEIKPGIIEKGEIKDQKTLATIIKKSIKEVQGVKLKTNYVIASLPEEKSFLQVIQMPIMEEHELKDAVCFEAENYIPLPLNEVYLDCQKAIPFFDHLDHTDALLIALPKKIVDPYISVFKEAGLIPKVLETESQAVSRALIENEVSPFPILIINVDKSKTNLIIFSGHSLRFTSVIAISSLEFNEAISKGLGIGLDEAEKLKKQYGISERYRKEIEDIKGKAGVDKSKIFSTVTPLLIDLIEQVRTHLNYYQSHVSHEHLPSDSRGVEKIILCGEGANMQGLVEFLATEIKIPVEIGNPWVNILSKSLPEVPELAFENSLAYTTALGLALRGIEER